MNHWVHYLLWVSIVVALMPKHCVCVSHSLLFVHVAACSLHLPAQHYICLAVHLQVVGTSAKLDDLQLVQLNAHKCICQTCQVVHEWHDCYTQLCGEVSHSGNSRFAMKKIDHLHVLDAFGAGGPPLVHAHWQKTFLYRVNYTLNSAFVSLP